MSRLWVWFPPHLIGTIEQTDTGLSFSYSEEWINYDRAFRLSYSLPIGRIKFEKEAASFFGNLLPEGSARDSLCRKFGISVDNDFELLSRIGEDCAGAFIITKQSKLSVEPEGVQEIPLEQLAHWLKNDSSGLIDLQVKGDLRLSLAGAQSKLPLIYKDGKFFKPLGSQPTTHILKPAPKNFKNIPLNEWINARLFAEFGLKTAHSELVKIGSRYALLVERYDRIKINEKWIRLHQEDFCQALAISYKKKYEQEKGPSLLDCQSLIDMRSDDAAEDIDSLIKWQILNVLIGNCDGHGKNLSLLRDNDGAWKLAPFYDLVATTIYPRLTKNLAMSINEQFESGNIHPTNWRKQFELLQVSPTHYIRIIQKMIDEMPKALNKVLDLYEEKYGANAFLPDYKAHQLRIIRRNSQLLKLDTK